MSNKYVIVDIDGTVSIVGDRVKHLSEKPCNWDAFYSRCGEDLSNKPIVKLVRSLMFSDYEIVYMTGRRDSEYKTTMSWLGEHMICSSFIYMRKNGDFRHDTEVKPEMMQKFLQDINGSKEEIAFILEDRNSMVKKWRELGFICLQVAEGDF